MATPGKNVTLWVGASPAKVKGLQKVNCGISAGTFDTSALGDTWESFMGGLFKGDAVKADGLYDNTDTTGQVALRAALGTTIACEVRYGVTAKAAFTGLVTGFSTDADLAGGIKVSIAIQPSGAVTFTD